MKTRYTVEEAKALSDEELLQAIEDMDAHLRNLARDAEEKRREASLAQSRREWAQPQFDRLYMEKNRRCL